MRGFWGKAAWATVAVGLSLGLVGCGDDDDTAADDVTGESSDPADTADTADTADAGVTEYCAYSAGLDEGDAFPTDEQLEELRELAPEEISSQVDLVVDQLIEEGEAVFADEEGNAEFFAAFEEIEAYEEEHCGRDDPDTEEVPADAEE